MASAYELMLVLRGRNYLSNDLRKASADIRGLSRGNALASLSNQRKQLGINAQRLAGTKQIAQAELGAIQTGTRRITLDQRTAKIAEQRLALTQKITTAEKELTAAQAAQVANADRVATTSTTISRTPVGSQSYAALREQHAALLKLDQDLIAEQLKLAESLKELQLQSDNLAISEQKLIAAETELAQRSAVLTDKINTTSAALALNAEKIQANELATARASSQLSQYGLVAEHVGRTFQTFGLIASAAVAGAAYVASKYSTGGVLAATQLITPGQSSPQNIVRTGGVVNDALLKFMASGQSVASAADLQQAAYNIPSGIPSLRGDSNQKAKETIALIKEFNQVTKANYGLVDLNGVTEAGIILINTFGTSISHLPREFDVMQSAVNRGKVTLGEFVKGLSQTAPAAKAAGYNFDSMASVLSFLSGKLPQYTRVAVGYARALELFQNKKFEDYMKSKGAAITDLTGKLLPYNQIIAQILKVDPSLTKAGNLISFLKTASGASGFMQARRVLTVSLQDQAGLNRAIQAVPANAQGLVNASATALSTTGAVKWKELTTQFKALVIVLGQGVIPVFQQLSKPLQDVLHWFNSLSPQTRHLVGEITAIIAVSSLLGGTLLIVAGMFARAYIAIRDIAIGRGGLAALSAESGALQTRLALGLGLLILIPLMIHFHKQIGEIIKKLGGLKGTLEIIGAAFLAYKGYVIAVGIESVVAAGGVGILEGAVIALNAVLAATPALAAAALAALAAYEITKKNSALNRAINDSVANAPGLPIYHNGKFVVPGTNTPVKDQAYWMRQFQQTFPGSIKPIEGETAYQYVLNQRNTGPRSAGNDLAAKIAHATGLLQRGTGPTPTAATAFTNADVLKAVQGIVKLDELAGKHPSIANYEKAAKALAALQTNANKEQFAAAQQLISALESAQTKADNKEISAAKKKHNKLLAEEKKAAAERLQALKDAESNVQSLYDSLLSQNQAVMGSLFSGPYISSPQVQNRLQFGGTLTGSDYLKDLKSQSAQFKTFYAQIGRLQKRGAPQELINQLIAAGPSALPAIKALSSMGKNQWGEYIKVFQDGQKLLHKQTMTQLTEQLKDYRKYGNKIALQIISGMRDKRIGLSNELKKLIENMFGVNVPTVHNATRTAVGNAQKVARDHHATRHSHAYSGHTTHTKPVVGTATRTTQGVTINNHYNVTAPTSEHTSIKTQLRHAEFARKAKYKSGVTPG